MCHLSCNLRSLNLLEHTGPVQDCNGIFFFNCQVLSDMYSQWGKFCQCLHRNEVLTHVARHILVPTALALACHSGGQGFIPEQCMGYLWCTEWHLDRFSFVYLVLSVRVLSPFVTNQHCYLSNSGDSTAIKSQSNTSVKSVACQLCVQNNLRNCGMLITLYLRLTTGMKQTRVDSCLCTE